MTLANLFSVSASMSVQTTLKVNEACVITVFRSIDIIEDWLDPVVNVSKKQRDI